MISFDITRRLGNPRFRSLSPRRLYPSERLLSRRDIVKDNKRHQILYQPRTFSLRRVPAFTIQTEQFNTRPYTPVSDPGARRRKRNEMFLLCKTPPPPKDENLRKFQRLYEDHRFPIRLTTVGSRQKRQLEWLVDPNQLNGHDCREIFRRFAVGLPVEREPYSLIAVQGFKDLLSTSRASHMLAESLTEVVPNIRKGLNSQRTWKKLEMLELIDQIAQLQGIGPLLLPFYRMLLPPLRIAKATRISTDISTSERDRLHRAIERTLAILEQSGGENALINIKYLIPQYQSSIAKH